MAELIAQGADFQEIDDEIALTPLVEAALAGHTATVVMLIENGAYCSVRSKRYSDYCQNAGK